MSTRCSSANTKIRSIRLQRKFFSLFIRCNKQTIFSDELAANAIVFCFGAALAQAQRFGGTHDLIEQPIVTKAIQLVNGYVDLVALQLNTMNLNDPDGVKNLVWVEKALPFYVAKSQYENLEQVEELNMDTFRKLANLLLY
jgi:hypothetical protein